MTDGYWSRLQQLPVLPQSGVVAGAGVKRPRPEYDLPPSGVPSNHEMLNYYPIEDRSQAIKDTKTIGSAYDRYLQNAQASFFSGEASALTGGGIGRAAAGVSSFPVVDASVMSRLRPSGPELAPNGCEVGFSGLPHVDVMPRPGRETVPLPPDASNTLYVEGLPPDCTRREVAHIFRPFVGYKELRLVSKDPKHRGGDPIVLCFVDFENPACAATALSALQGYKMDEDDPDSNYLRLQFSRYPGPRSGYGGRGKR